MKWEVVLLASAALAATPALTAVTPFPSPGDPRMRVVRYASDEVVELTGDLGYEMTIEFGDGERLENVSIGDAQGWQVTPNRRANLLFLKPIDHAPLTNMTVVTNLRHYAFELRVRARPPERGANAIIYGLRFLYPLPPPPPPRPVAKPKAPPQVVNDAYSYDGSAKNLPQRVFDDGKSTYFQFADAADYPAIFAIGAEKGEAVVNFSIHDGYLVVDQIARGFVLRRGTETTRLYNDGYRSTAPGPLSPRPRAKPGRWRR
ncbi:MAG TPA: TrbG/VirB9 family P-type conjugative transfer protein [Caulobacteraceae bacterium]